MLRGPRARPQRLTSLTVQRASLGGLFPSSLHRVGGKRPHLAVSRQEGGKGQNPVRLTLPSCTRFCVKRVSVPFAQWERRRSLTERLPGPFVTRDPVAAFETGRLCRKPVQGALEPPPRPVKRAFCTRTAAELPRWAPLLGNGSGAGVGGASRALFLRFRWVAPCS